MLGKRVSFVIEAQHLRLLMPIETFIEHAASNSLEVADVRAHCDANSVAPLDFVDSMAELVATRYLSREWTFATADTAINGIFNFATTSEFFGIVDNEVREFLLGVYTAFDQGEFHHNGDAPEIDPQFAYTMPLLKKVMEARNAVQPSAR